MPDQDQPEQIRILIIDDQPTKIDIIRPAIKIFDPSIKIDNLSDPTKAVEWIQKNDYDVILIDNIMPIISGLELVKIIKQHKKIPTILYTGANSKMLQDTAREAGADAYVPSHVEVLDYRSMINTIKAVLDPLKLNTVHDCPVTSLYESLNTHDFSDDNINQIEEALSKIREHENYIRRVSDVDETVEKCELACFYTKDR